VVADLSEGSATEEVKKLFERAIECVESSSMVPWIDYAQEVLSLAFTNHRYIVISSFVKKIEEPYRPIFTPEVLTLRKSISFEFYLGKCIDAVNDVLVFSEALLNVMLKSVGVNRATVGIAKIVAFIQRSISSTSSYIPPKSLAKLLNELYIHVMSVIGVRG
jgi:hypothetical protein